MELKTYVFLYRREGSFKRIPANQWRDFLDCKIALPNIKKSEFKTTEIQILTNASVPRALHSIKAWQINVDLYGFVENALCNDLPKPKLSIPLSDLFPTGGNTSSTGLVSADIQLAAYVDALLSEPFEEDTLQLTSTHPSLTHHEVEHFVEQICLA